MAILRHLASRRNARAGTVAALASLALLAPATGAAADGGGAAAGAVSCDYWFVEWQGGFAAEVTIHNGGPAINGWTADLTFDLPSTLGSAWNAAMSQPDPYSMTAQDMTWNGSIGPGGAVTFGWVAFAAAHQQPALHVNGARC